MVREKIIGYKRSSESILVIGIGVGLFETGSSAFEEFLSQGETNFWFGGICLEAGDEIIELGRTLSFDDFHPGGVQVFSGEPAITKWLTRYPWTQARCFSFWPLRNCTICFPLVADKLNYVYKHQSTHFFITNQSIVLLSNIYGLIKK